MQNDLAAPTPLPWYELYTVEPVQSRAGLNNSDLLMDLDETLSALLSP